MLTRRTFILTGVAGSAILAGAYWLRGPRSSVQSLDAEALTILRALVPAMLEDVLPHEQAERRAAVSGMVDRVQQTIAGLPPSSQQELAELFGLLEWPPGRLAFAGLAAMWTEASTPQVQRVLERWRDSRFDLPYAAYQALRQLIHSAWYAAPESWSAIGYPGPPRLTT